MRSRASLLHHQDRAEWLPSSGYHSGVLKIGVQPRVPRAALQSSGEKLCVEAVTPGRAGSFCCPEGAACVRAAQIST